MKLGITGSRTITKFDFMPYFLMKDKNFRSFCRENGLGYRKITKVITGGAKGIDTLAYQTAESLGIRNLQFLPDRKKYPGKLIKKAFLERNKQIVDACDILLAVWNGKSRGTKNTLAYAKETNKITFTILLPQISYRFSKKGHLSASMSVEECCFENAVLSDFCF